MDFAHNSQCVDLWIDCRGYSDPASKKFCQHIGEHFQILKGIMRDEPRTKEILSEVKKFVAKNKLPASCIASVCRTGAHRSVAVNRIVTEVLKLKGYKLMQPTHLSRGPWKSLHRCNWCRECRDGHLGKMKLFKQACNTRAIDRQ